MVSNGQCGSPVSGVEQTSISMPYLRAAEALAYGVFPYVLMPINYGIIVKQPQIAADFLFQHVHTTATLFQNNIYLYSTIYLLSFQ